MKILNTLKQLSRSLQVSAVLAISYLAIFQVPLLWSHLRRLCRYIASAHFSALPLALLTFVLVLAGVSIWILSVSLAARLYNQTKKKAYAFLLAYLLLCTVTAPLGYAAQRYAYHRQQRNIAEMPEELRKEFLSHPPSPRTAVHTETIRMPVGPALLLLALWAMWKNERDDEQELAS